MGTVIGLVAFSIVALLAVGIGLPNVADGVKVGFQTVIHNPQLNQTIGTVQTWLSSAISGVLAHH